MLAASVAAEVCGIAFGVLFVVAGATKLAAGPAWPSQAAGLGVARPVAVAVPWIELAVGTAVAARLFMPWSAVVAIALLVAFTVLVVARLRAGDHPPCACFGAWSTRPLSWWHVARNVAMIGLAAVAAVNP
jgi:uncharacterized membrane protein YphA (DoxX/SURF4 family)